MKRYSGNRVAFLDILTNTLLIFVMLFAVAFLQIRPDSDSKIKKPKAEYIITITWQTDNKNDVDIWTRDPLDNIIFFRQLRHGLTHLDRDDLGYEEDKVLLPDGTEVVFPYNQEIVTIRGFIPGEWVFNVHLYSKMDKDPAIVQLRIDKINPTVETIFYKTVVLKDLGDEITVFRATMDSDGSFKNINEVYESLTEGILERTIGGTFVIHDRNQGGPN